MDAWSLEKAAQSLGWEPGELSSEVEKRLSEEDARNELYAWAHKNNIDTRTTPVHKIREARMAEDSSYVEVWLGYDWESPESKRRWLG